MKRAVIHTTGEVRQRGNERIELLALTVDGSPVEVERGVPRGFWSLAAASRWCNENGYQLALRSHARARAPKAAP